MTYDAYYRVHLFANHSPGIAMANPQDEPSVKFSAAVFDAWLLSRAPVSDLSIFDETPFDNEERGGDGESPT